MQEKQKIPFHIIESVVSNTLFAVDGCLCFVYTKFILKMEQTADTEVLRLLTSDEIIQLIAIYKTKLETRGYNYLITQKRLQELSAQCGPDIFRSHRQRI